VNLMLPDYDTWALRGPEEQHELGTEPGDSCDRYPEPDGDEPHGYRPRPCSGKMIAPKSFGNWVICNVCGEMAE
jgi:hypothetical protein